MTTSVMERGRLSVEDFISISQLGPEDIGQIYALAERVKASPQDYSRALAGKQTALIFEKPSLRTRVTFEVGMTTLGGHAIFLDHTKPRLGEREPIKDIARNLERWVDCIVARTFQHEAVTQLAEHASIPLQMSSYPSLTLPGRLRGRNDHPPESLHFSGPPSARGSWQCP